MTMRALIEAVERGVWPGAEFHKLFTDDAGKMAYAAFNGSLDAALALHEAALPAWNVEMMNISGEVVLRRNMPIDRQYGDAIHAGNPARAWLLAILRAVEADGCA